MSSLYAVSPAEAKTMDTQTLRNQFLIGGLVQNDACNLVYTQYDRMIIGCVNPVLQELRLPLLDDLKATYFLERRELGIINVAGTGKVKADGTTYNLSKLDCLYLGKGTNEILFTSDDNNQPAVYFLLSCPAHHTYENRLMTKDEALPVEMGSSETCNERTIYKYIHNDGISSCQLVMGLTVLKHGSVWNTMPAHTHGRRMEAYFYFDVKDQQCVFHLMGLPTETRHLVVANYNAIVSPPWSIHSGCGTSNYSFIWGMAGENKDFTDMDGVKIIELR